MSVSNEGVKTTSHEMPDLRILLQVLSKSPWSVSQMKATAPRDSRWSITRRDRPLAAKLKTEAKALISADNSSHQSARKIGMRGSLAGFTFSA